MRVSLTQKGVEIKGTVSTEGDGLFVLEALSLVIEAYANKTGVPANEIVQDLYSLMNRRQHDS